MSDLYPFKFQTIFKEKIWGGQKIKSILGKNFSPLSNCGETWELSAVEGNISVVDSGHLQGTKLTELLYSYGPQIVGNRIYKEYGNDFPLLIKFIDANDDLSLQVHPDDHLALARHQSKGKTEMWYILQADDNSSLISGFNQPLDKSSYLEYFNENRLEEILNREIIKTGDVIFIPSGRVHTIGKGLLLAEIQQTSDITYRINDFDRLDADGNSRELHVEQALDAIDFTHYDSYKTTYQDVINTTNTLVDCPYFRTSKLNFQKEINPDYSAIDSFIIYICIEGSAVMKYSAGEMMLQLGDVFLIPTIFNNIELRPYQNCQILEVYVP